VLHIYDISSLRVNDLTLILLTWRKWTPNNASKWQMGFNSAFKGLRYSLISFLSFLVWPLVPNHCRCQGSWLSLFKLNGIHVICRTPLDGGSAPRRDFYLIIHKSQVTAMSPAGFDPRKRTAPDVRLKPPGHWDQNWDNLGLAVDFYKSFTFNYNKSNQ